MDSNKTMMVNFKVFENSDLDSSMKLQDDTKTTDVDEDVEQIVFPINQTKKNETFDFTNGSGTVDHTFVEVPDNSLMSDETIDMVATGFIYLFALIIFLFAF